MLVAAGQFPEIDRYFAPPKLDDVSAAFAWSWYVFSILDGTGIGSCFVGVGVRMHTNCCVTPYNL